MMQAPPFLCQRWIIWLIFDGEQPRDDRLDALFMVCQIRNVFKPAGNIYWLHFQYLYAALMALSCLCHQPQTPRWATVVWGFNVFTTGISRLASHRLLPLWNSLWITYLDFMCFISSFENTVEKLHWQPSAVRLSGPLWKHTRRYCFCLKCFSTVSQILFSTGIPHLS